MLLKVSHLVVMQAVRHAIFRRDDEHFTDTSNLGDGLFQHNTTHTGLQEMINCQFLDLISSPASLGGYC